MSKSSELSESLKAMRASCRKFLNTLDNKSNTVLFAIDRGHWTSWTFMSSLGELRGSFGIHIAIIASRYGLNVESDLASIMPDEPDEWVPNPYVPFVVKEHSVWKQQIEFTQFCKS